MIDLLVVGGGPAGLGTALQAAAAGLEVTLLESRSAPIDKACGEGIMPGAVERLRRMGAEPTGRPFRGIAYLDDHRTAMATFRDGPGLGVMATRRVLEALTEPLPRLWVPLRDQRESRGHDEPEPPP